MSILKEIFISISHYGAAIKLVRKHKMWPLLIISTFLFLIIFLLCGWLIYISNNVLIDWILNLSWVKGWSNFFDEASWIITTFKISINIATLFLFISLSKFVLLTIGSPLYAYISEAAAEKYLNVSYPFKPSQFIKDILRGIRLSIRNFLRQIFLTAILFFLSFIPVIGLVFTLLIIVLDAYYYGFSMIDYCCERDKKNVRESLAFVRAHRGLALGNGIVFYAAMVLIPFIGIIFIAPLSAIAAMISYFHITEKI